MIPNDKLKAWLNVTGNPLCTQAADRIDALEKELEALKALSDKQHAVIVEINKILGKKPANG